MIMNASFNESERTILARLADVLIPPDGVHLSASQAEVAGQGLDEILRFRPDLETGLKILLQRAEGKVPAEFIRELQTSDPAGFGVLTELIPGAYFLNSQVRASLGYHGQTPRPIDPHPDYLDDGLLQSVKDRGPIYRATPKG